MFVLKDKGNSQTILGHSNSPGKSTHLKFVLMQILLSYTRDIINKYLKIVFDLYLKHYKKINQFFEHFKFMSFLK